jgi:uncharacterized repeat protein (TIGR01451 family)
MRAIQILQVIVAFMFLPYFTIAYSATAPALALQQLGAGQEVDLIVEYDDQAIEQVVTGMRKRSLRNIDDPKILTYKIGQYRTLKNKIDRAVLRPDIKELATYSHMPMSFKRFSTVAALNVFLAQAGIKSVHVNEKMYRVMSQSLPLINQPPVTSVGERGAGTTVAVIDDGINFSNTAFGSCTAPGTPSACRVVVSNNIATSPGVDHTHGTNVSAIVLGVAPDSKIAMLNVFDASGGALVSDIILAIDWAIANKSTYNIVAINMSLGGATKFTSTCSRDWSNSPINRANDAGISVVVASGNSTFINGLSSPACAPRAISVGAVYDSNIGGVTWSTTPNCTDASSVSDKVTCFSNSASFLTLLAPGAFITAAGISIAGTSQASPHVAGAVAVLRSTFPSETLTQTLTRMTSKGVLVTDARNGIVKPRLNLLEAARPSNDAFANRLLISGNSGVVTGISVLATKEAAEPSNANDAGGSSLWWKWVAPSSGQLSINTIGSSFDTLIGLYTGANVSSLNYAATNDILDGTNGAGGLLMQVVAGQEYALSIDGISGASGTVNLNWNLNTSATANLSVSISGPPSVTLGSNVNYTVSVNNVGPQYATNTVVTVTLPIGANFVSASTGCTLNLNAVTCLAGTISASGVKSFNIQLTWNAITASASILASVNSDLADVLIADNSYSTPVAFNSPTYDLAGDTDSPALPQWGILLLAMILVSISIGVKKSSG